MSYAVSNLDSLNLTNTLNEDHRALKLVNPMDSNRAWLRSGLESNLLETLERNIRHNPSRTFKIFELGHVFSVRKDAKINSMPVETERVCALIHGSRGLNNLWDISSGNLDFYDLKGILDLALHSININPVYDQENHAFFKSGHSATISVSGHKIGYIGELDSSILEKFGLINRDVFLFSVDVNTLRN
jgi:phenylalanyl-tRNA synthetase beta chain